MANTGPAHAARRGQKDTEKSMLARSATRARNVLHAGPREAEIAVALKAAGVGFIQQFPFGKYNIDFMLPDLMVCLEIVSGSGNFRIARDKLTRNHEILKHWTLAEIHLGHTEHRKRFDAGKSVQMVINEVGTIRCAGRWIRVRGDGRIMPRYQKRSDRVHTK